MRVLIANRGEVALRICRTVQRMGGQAITVHHGEDRYAPFVEAADDAREICNFVPSAAYLEGQQIVQVARHVKADAIHPGYGFLSENADFARAVTDAGIVFVGPSADVIETMGDKTRAVRVAQKLGLRILPLPRPETTSEFEVKDFPFPLLVKAAAGGGGKGMRLVRGADELQQQLDAASHEAERYFGDNRVFLEHYIENARHIEIQVFGDGMGGGVHLGERDCSIQRNYQKIVEETPALDLDAELRESMCEAALALVRETNYSGVGTVEFLLAPDGEFYFLEMNTRLQVEHPVTECVTGLDLVQLQLEFAQHGKLPISQYQVRFQGHALETRICAEDPDAGFRPSTGRLLRYIEPDGDGVRFDSGVKEGQDITASFDSMLAKLIVHTPSRAESIARARQALADLTLLGIASNVDFLQRLLALESYAEAPPRTSFLEENAAQLVAPALTREERDRVLIAALLGTRDARRLHEVAARLRKHWTTDDG